jgi:hypothetical protein
MIRNLVLSASAPRRGSIRIGGHIKKSLYDIKAGNSGPERLEWGEIPISAFARGTGLG